MSLHTSLTWTVSLDKMMVATDVLSSFPRYIKKVYEGTQDP